MSSFTLGSDYTAARAASLVRSKAGGAAGTGSKYLDGLRTQYENLKLGVGDTAFGKAGVGNVTVSKEYLREVESSPEKKAEFEDLLKKCDEVAQETKVMGKGKIISQGFRLDEEGTLTSWTVSKNSSDVVVKLIAELDEDEPGNWYNLMTANLRIKGQSNWEKKFGS